MRIAAASKAEAEDMQFGLNDPHQKGPLTTPIGRIIERASYSDLLVGALVTLAGSTGYFRLAPFGHSLSVRDPSLFDTAYFSVVTFTSLGYGELSPQGFGRLVAMFVVVAGLALIALLVGKFASERQQAILQLLHSSDCQRRLVDFAAQLETLILNVQAATAAKNISLTKDSMRELSSRVAAVSNFLVFNANQAKLIEFGNESALFALYLQLRGVYQMCIGIHKAETLDVVISRRSRAIAGRSLALVKLMSIFHGEADRRTSYLGALCRRVRNFRHPTPFAPSALAQRVTRLWDLMAHEDGLFKVWVRSGLTPATREDVWSAAPSGLPNTWPAGVHKQLAQKLGISNTLAQKCLGVLLKNGRLPK
ncbi:potassium channel family protein [Paucibacter sp. R3-3]|uniref:Potassium channel family protein n=1 Tax=Roseateles agri TaxID=3098619 RepID=A0ABU5DG38_9BURK|nr:potassium channel family protein [Paucibacter sp. R3-3]MDY0744781.1 potassium channel family protein [Paucibacter sp. R3-3]